MGGIVDAVFGSEPEQVGPTQGDIERASQPYGLMGPSGGITWDYANKMGTATLSPEMMALANRLFGRAEETAAMTGITPEDYYSQFVEPDLLAQQERERLAMENRPPWSRYLYFHGWFYAYGRSSPSTKC